MTKDKIIARLSEEKYELSDGLHVATIKLRYADDQSRIRGELLDAVAAALGREGWGNLPDHIAQIVTISNPKFRALMDWFMVSDPWPLKEDAHLQLLEFLNQEANKRGHDSWIEAYHDKEIK
jgi:hypothetical protein